MKASCWIPVAVACWLAVNALAAEGPRTFQVSEFTFTRPTDWEWVETTSRMRKAQLQVAETGKKAEVIFFYFGEGEGGNAKANVERWLGQFKEPRDKVNAKTEEAAVKGRKITYVQAEGTYLSGMPGGPTTPQPGSMLLGAIVEGKAGNVFVRMTGPAELVKKSRDTFRNMVESAPP